MQDAGSPHIGCNKVCCTDLFDQENPDRKVVSLGLIDPRDKKRFLFEASPDLPTQMHMLLQSGGFAEGKMADGMLLTHAHIGHYSGLMYLGKEGLGAVQIPVYAMPRMQAFLRSNGPWSQLVDQQNISLQPLTEKAAVQLTSNLRVTPILVPHRDEFSETVGYVIEGPDKQALFIPDIDKWAKWTIPLIDAIASVDIAFVDGTFYDASEIPHRDMSEIPHPFVVETMSLLDHLPASEKQKVHFIHFNHTNPLLNAASTQSKEVIQRGYKIARLGDIVYL